MLFFHLWYGSRESCSSFTRRVWYSWQKKRGETFRECKGEESCNSTILFALLTFLCCMNCLTNVSTSVSPAWGKGKKNFVGTPLLLFSRIFWGGDHFSFRCLCLAHFTIYQTTNQQLTLFELMRNSISRFLVLLHCNSQLSQDRLARESLWEWKGER